MTREEHAALEKENPFTEEERTEDGNESEESIERESAEEGGQDDEAEGQGEEVAQEAAGDETQGPMSGLRFEIDQDEDGDWWWVLFAGNGRPVAMSPTSGSSEKSVRQMIYGLRKIALRDVPITIR